MWIRSFCHLSAPSYKILYAHLIYKLLSANSTVICSESAARTPADLPIKGLEFQKVYADAYVFNI